MKYFDIGLLNETNYPFFYGNSELELFWGE